MGQSRLIAGLLFSLISTVVPAGDVEWGKLAVPGTGASVDLPVSIFTEDAGPPEGGAGRRFFTADHRADLTLQSVANPENDTPATFLAKRRPPRGRAV